MRCNTGVTKDRKGEALISVMHREIEYSAVDVAYTISQNYQKVTVSDNVYLGLNFPLVPIIVETNQIQPTFTAAGFYFDADGIFMFHGDSEPNPDRAANEFIKLANDGKIIMGPTMTKFNVTADEVLVRTPLGNSATVYIYNDN